MKGEMKDIQNNNISCTLDTRSDCIGVCVKSNSSIFGDLRIRKLTPKECWRLMNFDDECYDKAAATGMSNMRLYKQAGNSIVVGVLERILRELFIGEEND